MDPAVSRSYLLGQMQLPLEDAIEEEIITHFYVPPKSSVSENKGIDLLTFATSNRNSYESEGDRISKVIESIRLILQSIQQIPDQRAYINEGYEEEQKFIETPKSGRPCMLYTWKSMAYEFLKNPAYFDENSINIARVDEDIEKLRRQAATNYAIAKVFASIACSNEFKKDPVGYIDCWSITVAAQSTVLESFESVMRKTTNSSQSSSCMIS